ncbi:MAG: zinc ribbon domain-containing protein [Spirochaetales bacterium]|nr:zinc ribbon domain-containing protein [Spirochaetales bacterium]
MEEEKFCKHCQKPLKAEYQFCPYCGALNLDDRQFRLPMEPEIVEEHENLDKLDLLEACLDILDSEISRFLATK